MTNQDSFSTVLITGGTGSFGQAFTKRLIEYKGLQKICIYSRDEYKQSLMRKSLNDDRLRYFIGDVRDRDRLKRAMQGIDLVVHAAALKRIEVGHYDPIEMVKTNVNGSINVIEAAQDANVPRVVYLSTDKAYQPISAYGASKCLSESLFLAANNITGGKTRFAVTRYGNVAGSTGSVIPVWRSLLDTPRVLHYDVAVRQVPVTDPDCTRFYMTMRQATDLVWDTAQTMPNTVAIPDLPAYRLGDLADAMGADMLVTGLPAWEKKHESMGPGQSSEHARRMTVDELREAIAEL